MSASELKTEYARLRRELENAYAAPVWNSGQIDRIANAIARIERAFMRHSVIGGSMMAAKSSAPRQFDMTGA